MSEPVPQPTTRRIDVGGFQLTADHLPGPGRPVVLVHGGGQTRHSWGGTAAALHARGHETLVYDQRGHGDSDWDPDGRYEFPDFADDAPHVLDAVGRPAIWVGASLGGMAGMLTAPDDDRVAGLVLVDITHRPRADGVSRILEFMRADLEHGFESLEAAADAVAAYQPHRTNRSDPEGLRKNLRLGDDGRWRWHWDPRFMGDRGPSGDTDRYDRLEAAARRLRCPVLLVRGRRSDLVTDDEVEAFRAVVPHADVVDVSGAAHMVAGDRNDVFNDAVIDWIADRAP